MAILDDNNLSRLINQNRQYEGGGIAPLPQGGRRIPTISNLKILRNQSVIGGAKITLSWSQDSTESTDYFNIVVFSPADFSLFSTDQNPRDIAARNDRWSLYQSPTVVERSPAELFIPANQKIPVTISVATRHSSGILSSIDFQSSVSTMLVP